VVGKTERILGTLGRSLRGSRILLLGMTYKKNLPDQRESPGTKIAELLIGEGADVTYHDPLVPQVSVDVVVDGRNAGSRELRSQALDRHVLTNVDMVVIITDHSNVSYDVVVGSGVVTLDTRNVTGRLGIRADNVWLM
jgi:UDP-N-acetyl-D-glucosamine dehydrogenase